MLIKRFPWTFMQPLIGLLSFIFLCFNVLMCGVVIHLIGLYSLISKRSTAWKRAHCDRCYDLWVKLCEVWFCKVLGMRWHLDKSLESRPQQWHLLIANHQSWVDVFVVLLQIRGRMPLPRIFMKQALVWLPLVGTATKLMGFPQVKRYSKATLAKHPELVDRDRQATRAACVSLMQTPSSVMTFAEGTRFTQAKHSLQCSPYKHLLRPKAGGLWMVLQAMPGRFTEVTDLNIVYPESGYSFWDLLCGRVDSVYVKTRQIAIPAEFQTPSERTDKQAFYQWVNECWERKDNAMAMDMLHSSKLEIQRNRSIKKENSLLN